MKYQSVLFILLLAAIIAAPATASLKKVNAEAPVFVGETGLDISSALNGCRQIAWWPAGNTTDNPPDKVIALSDEEMRNYTFDPAVFSDYTGIWYSYDKKPSVEVFKVVKPEFTLRIWDLDHNKDVSGESVPVGTRITYRIDTNLYPVFNKYKRPDVNKLDSFMEVSLAWPNGREIPNIYTGSAGGTDTVVLPFETAPKVEESPYYWVNGGRWNHTARAIDGTIIYPLGTYTFVGSQDLNGMKSVYNATDPAVTSGPVTITFVAEGDATETPSVAPPETTLPATNRPETVAPSAAMTEQTVPGTSAAKETWTSTPLAPETALLALCIACACSLFIVRKQR